MMLFARFGLQGCCERRRSGITGTSDMNACLSCAVENPRNDLGLHCIRGCCGAIADMRAAVPASMDNDLRRAYGAGLRVEGYCVLK